MYPRPKRKPHLDKAVENPQSQPTPPQIPIRGPLLPIPVDDHARIISEQNIRIIAPVPLVQFSINGKPGDLESESLVGIREPLSRQREGVLHECVISSHSSYAGLLGEMHSNLPSIKSYAGHEPGCFDRMKRTTMLRVNVLSPVHRDSIAIVAMYRVE